MESFFAIPTYLGPQPNSLCWMVHNGVRQTPQTEDKRDVSFPIPSLWNKQLIDEHSEESDEEWDSQWEAQWGDQWEEEWKDDSYEDFNSSDEYSDESDSESECDEPYFWYNG